MSTKKDNSWREDGANKTPKVMFRRPNSRDNNLNNNNGFPGLRLVNNFNNPPGSRGGGQIEKVLTIDDSFPATTKPSTTSSLLAQNSRQALDLKRIPSREGIGSKTLVPIRSQNDMLLSREVDKEIGSMQMQQRMRDMESMIIDLKGNMERRLQKITEEQPGKFMANFKRLEDKEGQFWKDSTQKQSMINDQYSILKETMRKQNEQNGQALLEMQRKIDEVAFQNHKLQKSQEQMQVYIKNGPLQAIEDGSKRKQQYDPAEGQLALIKEQFNQELRIRENALEEQNKNYMELQRKIHEQEKEFLVRLAKQRDAIIDETTVHKLQIKQLEGVKMEKLMGENDYLKQLIDQVERRLEDEMDKRLKQEFQNKAYLDQKINLFKDEVRNEEKSIIEGEQRFVRQMNESIQSIHQIIKFSKEELEANLASTQTLFAENIKNFQQQMEVIKENVETKVMLLERGYKDLNFKVNETKQSFHEHANIISMQVEKQNEEIERKGVELNQQLDELSKETKASIVELQGQNDIWRDKFEKKNLAIFQEISNAMKGLKQEMTQEKRENLARAKDLREEIESYQKMNEKLAENMKEHVERTQASTEFLIAENDKKAQDALAQSVIELEKLLAESDEKCLDKAKAFALMSINDFDARIRADLANFVTNYPKELTRRLAELKDELQDEMNANNAQIHEKIKQNRLNVEELHDQTIKTLEKDRKDALVAREQQREDVRAARNEALDNLRRAIDQMKQDTDSKVTISEKKQEMALMLQNNDLQRLISESAAKQNENLHQMRKELIEQFRLELEENVLQRLLREIEQEKNERMQRETEIETAMHNIKNMMLEALHQKISSANALARALVTEEAAERAKNDDEILKFMKDGLETMDKTLRLLIKTSIEECMYILRQEIKALEDKLNEFKDWTIKELRKIQEEFKDWQNEIRAENYLRDMYQRLREEEFINVCGQIERELIGMKQNREEDLLVLIQEIQMREQEIARVDSVLDDHEGKILEQRADHEQLRVEYDEHSNWAKDTIQQQREDFDSFKDITGKNVRFLDAEVKHHYKYFEGRLFLDAMYGRIQTEAIIDQSSSQKEKVKKIYSKLREMIVQINENFVQQEIFEEKTEKNFKIAEKAIKAHSSFLNSIDARLHYEELMNKLCNEDLARQNQEIRQQMSDNLLELNDEMARMMDGMKQENMDKIDVLERANIEVQEKVDQQAQRIEDHEEKLDNYTKQLALVESDLKVTEQGLNQRVDEALAGIDNNIQQFNEDTAAYKEEIGQKFQETNDRINEAMEQINEATGRIDEASQKIEEATQRLDENVARIDEFTEKNEEMKQQFEDVNQKIEEFNAKNEEAAASNEEINQKFADVNEKLEEVNARVEESAQKNEEFNQRFEELTTKHEEMLNGHEALVGKTEEIEQRVEEMNAKHEEVAQKIEEMGGKVDDVANKQEKDDEEGDQKDSQQDKVDVAQSQQIQKMQEDMEEMAQKLQGLTTQIEDKDQNIEDLGDDIHKQIERIDQIEEAMAQLKKGGGSRVGSTSKIDNSKLSEPKENNASNQSFQRKMDNFEEEVQNLKEQFEAMKSEEIQQLRQELEDQVQRLTEQIEDMANQSKSGKKSNPPSANVSKDNREVQEVREEVENMRLQMEEYKQDMEETKAQLQATGEALEEIKEIDDRIQKIESRIAKVESK